jgi:hypothetical protein
MSAEAKWPGHEADHLPLTRADVKNNGTLLPRPLSAFMAWNVTYTSALTLKRFNKLVVMGFFSLRHRVQTGSGAHPASDAMGTGSKAAGA